MNILVTGANGQLGNEMRLATRESSDRYIFTDVAELDITDAAAVEKTVTENDIRLIINCAAYTNVEKAVRPLRGPLRLFQRSCKQHS